MSDYSYLGYTLKDNGAHDVIITAHSLFYGHEHETNIPMRRFAYEDMRDTIRLADWIIDIDEFTTRADFQELTQ